MAASKSHSTTTSHDGALQLRDRTLQWLQVLWELEQALMARSKWMEATIGITGQQRLVLRLIADFSPVSASSLAATLMLHASTISGILHRLDEAQLIQKTADPCDRRRVLIQLTPLGEEILEHNEGTIEQAVRHALISMDQSEIETTERVITALTKQIQDRGLETPGSKTA